MTGLPSMVAMLLAMMGPGLRLRFAVGIVLHPRPLLLLPLLMGQLLLLFLVIIVDGILIVLV